MRTHFPSVVTAAMLLAMASTLAIAQAPAPQNPQDTAQPADQAPTKKQCEDMKKMDPSTMSKSEHDAMMKKCKNMEKKKSKNGY